MSLHRRLARFLDATHRADAGSGPGLRAHSSLAIGSTRRDLSTWSRDSLVAHGHSLRGRHAACRRVCHEPVRTRTRTHASASRVAGSNSAILRQIR